MYVESIFQLCFVYKTAFINTLNGFLYNFKGFYLYIMDLNQYQ